MHYQFELIYRDPDTDTMWCVFAEDIGFGLIYFFKVSDTDLADLGVYGSLREIQRAPAVRPIPWNPEFEELPRFVSFTWEQFIYTHADTWRIE